MKYLVKVCSSGLLLILLNGCMTFSSDKLADLEPIKPASTPSIQAAVGQFTAQFDDDQTVVTGEQAGQEINDKIMQSWKEHGYISDFTPVKNANGLGDAQYSLVLKGSQQDTSNKYMKIISALSFLIIPATIETAYDLNYELTELASGNKYTVKIADSVNMTTWLLFFPAIPFSSVGTNKAFARIAEHIYQDFVQQGAFLNIENASAAPTK